jgi:hypothetical protein
MFLGLTRKYQTLLESWEGGCVGESTRHRKRKHGAQSKSHSASAKSDRKYIYVCYSNTWERRWQIKPVFMNKLRVCLFALSSEAAVWTCDDYNTELSFCLFYYTGVKLGLLYWGKNAGWGCSDEGWWRKYLVQRVRKQPEALQDCVMRSCITCTPCQILVRQVNLLPCLTN